MNLINPTVKVVSVEPVYLDKGHSVSGYFKVAVNEYDNYYNLSFIPIIDYIVQTDEKLAAYLKTAHDYENTKLRVSDVIQDLIEIGVPLQDYVQGYFNYVSNNMSSNLKFISALYSFFNPDGDDLTVD